MAKEQISVLEFLKNQKKKKESFLIPLTEFELDYFQQECIEILEKLQLCKAIHCEHKDNDYEFFLKLPKKKCLTNWEAKTLKKDVDKSIQELNGILKVARSKMYAEDFEHIQEIIQLGLFRKEKIIQEKQSAIALLEGDKKQDNKKAIAKLKEEITTIEKVANETTPEERDQILATLEDNGLSKLMGETKKEDIEDTVTEVTKFFNLRLDEVNWEVDEVWKIPDSLLFKVVQFISLEASKWEVDEKVKSLSEYTIIEDN